MPTSGHELGLPGGEGFYPEPLQMEPDTEAQRLLGVFREAAFARDIPAAMRAAGDMSTLLMNQSARLDPVLADKLGTVLEGLLVDQ